MDEDEQNAAPDDVDLGGLGGMEGMGGMPGMGGDGGFGGIGAFCTIPQMLNNADRARFLKAWRYGRRR